MKFKCCKIVIFLLVVILMAGIMLTGCKGDNKKGEQTTKSATTASGTTAAPGTAATSGTAAVSEEDTFSYPVDTDVTLKMVKWTPSAVGNKFDDYGDTEFIKALIKATGINIEYVHAKSADAVAVLLASGEPYDGYDISWTQYPGGLENAIRDGLIVPLEGELLEAAPNYMSALEKYDLLERVKTVDGYIPYITHINPEPVADYGIVVRTDWLEDCGLDLPETIDEFTEMLRAFRDEKGAAGTLSAVWPNNLFDSRYNSFTSAYGLGAEFFVKDDIVKYGPLEPEWKEYMAMIARWYAEGLFTKDYVSITPQIMQAEFYSGNAGVVPAYSTMMADLNKGGKEHDPNFSVGPCPNPVLNPGDELVIGFKRQKYTDDGWGVGIGARSENKELVVRLFDWCYTEEGTILSNYGIEGESFNIASDGLPYYTDIMFNTEGWGIEEMEGKYNNNHGSGPYIKQRHATIARIPEEYRHLYDKAFKLWEAPGHEKHFLDVGALKLLAEDATRANDIITEMKTLRLEYCYKFMLGDLPVNNDTVGEMVKEMKRLGIEDVLEIYQAGYDKHVK